MGNKSKNKKNIIKKLSKEDYESELQRLHFELIKLQEWVKKNWKKSSHYF